MDGLLTSVDFTLDGTGLVVGSTQGKIYQYDLRNSSAPTRITVAHKTSVTCLRFQSNMSRHKVITRPQVFISSTSSVSVFLFYCDVMDHMFISPALLQTSRLGSGKIASAKRSSTKLLNSQPEPAPSTGPALLRQKTSTGEFISPVL